MQEGLAEDVVIASVRCVEWLAREVLLRRGRDGRVQGEIQELEWHFDGQVAYAGGPEHEGQVSRRIDDPFELRVCGVPDVQVGVRREHHRKVLGDSCAGFRGHVHVGDVRNDVGRLFVAVVQVKETGERTRVEGARSILHTDLHVEQ